MTDPDLIRRLQDGTGADRELDAAIHLEISPNKARYDAEKTSEDGYIWDGVEWDWFSPPAYTGSLDACIALLGQVLRGWFWYLDTEKAEVWNGHGKRAEGHCDENGRDICRAFLIAILSAMELTDG
jgi:hypothetical protein